MHEFVNIFYDIMGTVMLKTPYAGYIAKLWSKKLKYIVNVDLTYFHDIKKVIFPKRSYVGEPLYFSEQGNSSPVYTRFAAQWLAKSIIAHFSFVSICLNRVNILEMYCTMLYASFGLLWTSLLPLSLVKYCFLPYNIFHKKLFSK